MQLAGIFVWWLIILIMGLAVWPMVFMVFRFLPDRGYAFSKPLGLLLVGLISWLIGFVHFSYLTILGALGLLIGFSCWLWMRYQEEMLAFWKNHAGYIKVVELFFAALFLLFLFFRMYNPDIIGTEKFMDLAFLNALTRTTSFPPYDPWLAGKGFYISYYYLGYLLMAILTKLSCIAPAIGFNLSLGMLFALSGVTVFGLLYNLSQDLRVAFIGWAAIFMLGNLDGFRQVLFTKSLENFNWWTPSRVIPDTINEFPFFSFLLGDMHPHMLSVPYILIILGFVLNQLKSSERTINIWEPVSLGRYALWGLLIGALGFMNSWDVPTTFFLTLLGFGFQAYNHSSAGMTFSGKNLGMALGLILAMMIVPYLPFYASFHSQAKGIAWTKQNTRLLDFFLLFGVFIFMAATFILARYHTWFLTLLAPPAAAKSSLSEKKKKNLLCPQCGTIIRTGKMICGQCGFRLNQEEAEQDREGPLSRPLSSCPGWLRDLWLFLLQPLLFWKQAKHRGLVLSVVLATVLSTLAAMLLKWLAFNSGQQPKPYLLGLAVFLLLVVGLLLITRCERPETLFALMLLFTAVGLIFGCEVLHIKDTFDAPLDRMNTVFKFYYQVWYLLGLASVYGTYWMFRYSLRQPNFRLAWWIPLVLLVAASLVYPYASALIKTNHFNNVATLDGSFYLKNSYPADREAIEWLRQNVAGHPVILEATGAEYTDFARVSTFTGLPTVLGWAGHELQWRGNYDEPAKRIPAIDTIYNSTNPEEAKALMEQYNIVYVFVGTLEREKHAGKGLDKFAAFMDPVYTNSGVTIYKKK